MLDRQSNKNERILDIYTKLLNGNIVRKSEIALKYAVNERSIQRDMDDIRKFLEKSSIDTGYINDIVYDYAERGHRLEKIARMKFSNSEILAICKILLDSRAFTKSEMLPIIDKLLESCVPKKNQSLVIDLIANEKFHYIEPQHHTVFIDKLWDLGMAIKENRYIELKYMRIKDKSLVTRKVRPVAIMFSEFYFYLGAYIENINKEKKFSNENDKYPTIYRVDRINNYTVLDSTFKIPYSERFEEGEFRKRVQFMYGGRLRTILFKYKGYDLAAILDRLPTAVIQSKEEDGWIIKAEVFGDGVDMWIRSQGTNIQILDERS